MNQVLIDKIVEKLKSLKQDGATITDMRVRQVIEYVAQNCGF